MALVTGARIPRRTDRILEAVQQQLENRRSALNADASIRSVTFEIKMRAGTDMVRAVIVRVESEATLEG